MAAAVAVNATQIKNQYAARYLEFTGAANAMDNSGVQNIFIIDVAGIARIACRIVVAINTLAAFVLKGLVNEQDTTYVTLKSTSTHFTGPSGVLIDASGDLTTQVAGGTGWFVMNVAGFAKIAIAANSSAAGGSTLAIFGSGI